MCVHKTVRQQSTVCLFSNHSMFNKNEALYKNVVQKGVKKALHRPKNNHG